MLLKTPMHHHPLHKESALHGLILVLMAMFLSLETTLFLATAQGGYSTPYTLRVIKIHLTRSFFGEFLVYSCEEA